MLIRNPEHGQALVALSAAILLAADPTQFGPELPKIWEQEIESKWHPGALCLPAIAEDRSVYVGSADGTLYSFDGGGLRTWKYDTMHEPMRFRVEGVVGVAIDGSGSIYAASDGLSALAKNGELKWKLWADGGTSAPALGAGGRIYVRHNRSLYAVTADGAIEWSREIDSSPSNFSPVVGKNGTVYAAGRSHTAKDEPSGLLYAFKPDGELKWTFEANYPASPALDDDGSIYFTEHRGLIAVDEDGQLKWIYETQGLLGFSTPAISVDHIVYVGVGHWLFAVDRDGKFKWRFETAGAVRSPA